MRESIKRGISFGLTSGIITTLGLIVGLNSGTGLRLAVIGGILTIAIADAFSDALGIHVSLESNHRNSHKAIWEATFATFLTKLLIASSFIFPFIICVELSSAVLLSIIWGFLLLLIFNYVLAKQRKENPWMTIFEHILIATVVIVIANFVGEFIAIAFN